METTEKRAVRYTYRGGKFTVVEDVYVMRKYNDHFGCVIGGMVVYLHERNDELAKRLLIEYNEERIVKLREQLHKATEELEKLKGES